jgi:hypothetical protein
VLSFLRSAVRRSTIGTATTSKWAAQDDPVSK